MLFQGKPPLVKFAKSTLSDRKICHRLRPLRSSAPSWVICQAGLFQSLLQRILAPRWPVYDSMDWCVRENLHRKPLRFSHEDHRAFPVNIFSRRNQSMEWCFHPRIPAVWALFSEVSPAKSRGFERCPRNSRGSGGSGGQLGESWHIMGTCWGSFWEEPLVQTVPKNNEKSTNIYGNDE